MLTSISQLSTLAWRLSLLHEIVYTWPLNDVAVWSWALTLWAVRNLPITFSALCSCWVFTIEKNPLISRPAVKLMFKGQLCSSSLINLLWFLFLEIQKLHVSFTSLDAKITRDWSWVQNHFLICTFLQSRSALVQSSPGLADAQGLWLYISILDSLLSTDVALGTFRSLLILHAVS